MPRLRQGLLSISQPLHRRRRHPLVHDLFDDVGGVRVFP